MTEQAANQQQSWSAADHQEQAADNAQHFPAADAEAGPGYSDPFMQEERLRRQNAASDSAPSASAAHGAASQGHQGHSARNSLRENSYNEDSFMRNERESRGSGDSGKSSQQPSERQPRPGGGTSRFPKRTVGGEPREVEYDDPFMRSERAARLPPQKPQSPKANPFFPAWATTFDPEATHTAALKATQFVCCQEWGYSFCL